VRVELSDVAVSDDLDDRRPAVHKLVSYSLLQLRAGLLLLLETPPVASRQPSEQAIHCDHGPVISCRRLVVETERWLLAEALGQSSRQGLPSRHAGEGFVADADATMTRIGKASSRANMATGMRRVRCSPRYGRTSVARAATRSTDARSPLADVQDDVHKELVWDLRALEAADLITDERAGLAGSTSPVAGFFPSLSPQPQRRDSLRSLDANGPSGEMTLQHEPAPGRRAHRRARGTELRPE